MANYEREMLEYDEEMESETSVSRTPPRYQLRLREMNSTSTTMDDVTLDENTEKRHPFFSKENLCSSLYEFMRFVSIGIAFLFVLLSFSLCTAGIVVLAPYRDGIVVLNGKEYFTDVIRSFPMYIVNIAIIALSGILCYISWLISVKALQYRENTELWNSGAPIPFDKWKHTITDTLPMAKIVPILLCFLYLMFYFAYNLICLITAVQYEKRMQIWSSTKDGNGLCQTSAITCHKIRNGYLLIIVAGVFGMATVFPLFLLNAFSLQFNMRKKRSRPFEVNQDGNSNSSSRTHLFSTMEHEMSI
jgi:hypothetical protein